jgi:hypothetical protein
MRFGETPLEGYGFEMVDFFRGESGIVGYKRGRFRGRHHIGGACGSRWWLRVIFGRMRK